MTHEEVLDEINVLYERISNPEDCENGCYSFSDGNYTEALEILIDYYEVGLIEELEKIKAEFEDIDWNVVSTIHERKKEFISKEVIYELLDKHISELKGVNK